MESHERRAATRTDPERDHRHHPRTCATSRATGRSSSVPPTRRTRRRASCRSRSSRNSGASPPRGTGPLRGQAPFRVSALPSAGSGDVLRRPYVTAPAVQSGRARADRPRRWTGGGDRLRVRHHLDLRAPAADRRPGHGRTGGGRWRLQHRCAGLRRRDLLLQK